MIITKVVLSALLIVGISEFAKTSPKWGAFLGALPIVTILAILWIYFESKNVDKIAEYSKYTFWYVLPTLPGFLIFPMLLEKKVNFWLSLSVLLAVSLLLLYGISLIAKKFGINLL